MILAFMSPFHEKVTRSNDNLTILLKAKHTRIIVESTLGRLRMRNLIAAEEDVRKMSCSFCEMGCDNENPTLL